ncbi:hypothetical protein BSKO_07508 [Bryopsis sp. KO-2023]|nr:hypothetical protein BSKO_07508 [Bryopsis sp. KO-2023]
MASSGLLRSQIHSARTDVVRVTGRTPRVGFAAQSSASSASFGGACSRVQRKRFERGISAELAAATSEDASTASTETQPAEWYAVVANAEFMLNDVQNEPLAEQLRERTRFFKEKSRDIDFYLVPNPVWLDEKYPDKGKLVKRPCVALVSTDKVWMTFMKLRLDQVLKFDLGDMEASDVLAAGDDIPPFDKPAKWTAPYPKYASGWWDVFYPNA